MPSVGIAAVMGLSANAEIDIVDKGVAQRLGWFVRVVGAAGMLVGTGVLAGYAFHIPLLTRFHSGLQAMSVLTAAGTGLMGTALVAESVGRRRLARSLGAIVLAGSLTLLCSHTLAGADVINRPLAEHLFAFDPEVAGRTSFATAMGLLLIAASLQFEGRPDVEGVNLSNACAVLGAAIGGIALMGYAYGVRDLYAFSPFNTMALQTAAGLFLLGLAAVVARPDRGWGAVIASDLAGGGTTRRQLGLTLLIPVAGAILLRATEARNVGPAMAMALLVCLTVASLVLLVLRDGRVQDQLDRERRSRSAVLAEARAELERELATRAAALDEATQERIRMEDALRQAQKMEAVGQLTGGVAHDFNNLLTVIKSSTDLLKRPNLAEERRQRYIGAISDTVGRAAKLTGQLLAFARRQALRPEVFDVGQGVAALSDMIGTLTGSRIQIVTDVPDDSCFVNADPSQFDTAIVNMAVNARDAMDGEGRLAITVHPVSTIPAIRSHPPVSGDFVAVCIEDTGSGIPADKIEHIFEPFFTTKGVGQGTGLGLSQVFGFAKQSGGEVRVQSEVGKGTMFVLYLPRVAAEAAAPESEPEPLIDGHGTRVLVVEDNVDVGTFATQTLAELGYVTTWATNAKEALIELAKAPGAFDVVFSDVVMPGMNGIDLGHEIRRLYHDLPVVLASGYSHVLAQNGTYGFELLHKPYSVEQLSRTLRKVATWRRRRRILAV